MRALRPLLHDNRYRLHWQRLLLLLTAVTAWFAFGPAPPQADVQNADKIHHLLAFGSMACVGAWSLRPGWRGTATTAAALLLYGLLIEAIQVMLPGRHGDWRDVGADIAGIAAGLLLAAALRRLH